MRKDLGSKTYLYPMPVLIIASYDETGKENAMNAAWGGISDDNQIAICLAAHKTTSNIIKTKAFTVSPGDAKHVVECDFVGIVSQNDDKDKMKKTGFSFTKSKYVNAPIINELPFTLECELISFDENTGILKGKIVNVSVDDSILTNNKIDLTKFEPISFDPANHAYVTYTKRVGNAFKDGLKIK